MGSFGISEGNITGRKEHTQDTHLTTTTSTDGEVAQTLKSTTMSGVGGLGREAQTASLVLRVRIKLEGPDDNLRELL